MSVASPNTIAADLMAKVETAARTANQTPEEWAAEAMERKLEANNWGNMLERNERRVRAIGIKESDLPRLIAESRRERGSQLRASRTKASRPSFY